MASYCYRFVEWMNCCCGGAETSQEANNNNNCGDEELLFPVSPLIPCRDTMFQHPRTNSCDLLFQLPTSMPLDSGYVFTINSFHLLSTIISMQIMILYHNLTFSFFLSK